MPCFADEAARLEELRLDALEALFEAELRCGREEDLVSEIEAFVAANPLREHARAQLMRALYRCGRQAEALAAYREGRRRLVDELGVEPDRELQELEREILRQEPQLESSPSTPQAVPASALGPLRTEGPALQQEASPEPPQKRRKIATVVFFDLTGPPVLGQSVDPEVLQGLLGQHSELVKEIVERHGGAVETFVGEAAMAVFGVPMVHEDDALRACRAALEMSSALPELGVEARIGLMTGEVLTGTEEGLATGDAVGVAARLREEARPGEVLIGESTRALVQDVAEVEAVPPLDPNGRFEPAAVFRLVRLIDARPREHEPLFVGRERELALLRQAWTQAQIEQRCELVTIVGEAGLGKSRLVAEFERTLGARVLHGRCLPYGKGITYWPLREIVSDLCQLRDPAAELGSRLAEEEHGEQIAGSILGAIGATEAGGSVEEVQWAVRRLFEALAAEQPLLVVLEDLHWAEPTFLQLVEYVADCAAEAPILLLAAAREELLETSPAWALPRPHSHLFALEPLAEPDAGRLVDALTGDRPISEQMRTRLVGSAGGNPLFLEQLVALLQAETGQPDGRLPLPTTITALLAARLDRLPSLERDVLERAAIEGLTFHRGPLTALLPDREAGDVGALLLDAIRRKLIRACHSRLPGDDGYEFVHVLVRDAVYQAMPKELRGQLHEQFADWLERARARRSSEIDEMIVGHHLERAYQMQVELGRPDPALARRAGERLTSAGRHAMRRFDHPAGRVLLERAVALSERPDVHLLADLARCQRWLGDPRAAQSVLEGAAARSEEEGDAAAAALARALAAFARHEGGDCTSEEAEQVALAAVPLLEAAGDHGGLFRIWNSLALGIYFLRGQFGQAEHAAEQAIGHTRLSGQISMAGGAILVAALRMGPRPAAEALAMVDAVIGTPPLPIENAERAVLLAMNDRIDEARRLAETATEQLSEFGGARLDMQHARIAEVEALCGDDEAAAEHLRQACAYDSEHGLTQPLSTYAPWHGRVLCALGRYQEAEPLAVQGRELGDEEDALTQSLWRQVAALVAAHRGDRGEAERLARDAVTLIEKTDVLQWQGDAHVDLGQVLEVAGRPEEAAAAYEEALERYERKQIIPLARSVRERLEALQPSHSG